MTRDVGIPCDTGTRSNRFTAPPVTGNIPLHFSLGDASRWVDRPVTALGHRALRVLESMERGQPGS